MYLVTVTRKIRDPFSLNNDRTKSSQFALSASSEAEAIQVVMDERERLSGTVIGINAVYINNFAEWLENARDDAEAAAKVEAEQAASRARS